MLTLMLIGFGTIIAIRRGPFKDLRLLAGTSLVVVWVSPFFTPAIANQQRDLDKIRFGGPIPFLQQATSMTPPASAFPLKIHRLLNPQEYPTQILWGRFWLSVLLMAGLIWVLWRAINALRRRLGHNAE